jgi:uncharacterized protein YqgC (DUF456 family)
MNLTDIIGTLLGCVILIGFLGMPFIVVFIGEKILKKPFSREYIIGFRTGYYGVIFASMFMKYVIGWHK